MADRELDDAIVHAAATTIGLRLEAALADPHAKTVTLTRDEALLTLGLVNGLAELIGGEAAKHAD